VSIGRVNIETEPTLQPGMAERAIDTATDAQHTITEVSAGLQAAVNKLSEAIAAARLPGRPLSIVSTITPEAPLPTVFVAFLFGYRSRTDARSLAISRRELEPN
jgi:hypothetical protein